MSFLQPTAQPPIGNPVALRVDGNAYSNTTNLTAGQQINTGWLDTIYFNTVFVKLFSDQVSSTNGFTLEISTDGSTVLDTASITYSTVNDFRRSVFTPSVRYFRYKYTNGATPTTKFALIVDFFTAPISPTMQGLTNTTSATNLATVTKAVPVLPDSGGTYDQIQRTGTSQNVNVTNTIPISGGLTDTQLRATAVPVSGTVTATPPASATANHTNVSSATSATTVLASNPNRKGATVYQDGSGTGYLKLGSGASATSYTIEMVSKSYYEVPFGYTGIITCLWTSTASTHRVVEFV